MRVMGFVEGEREFGCAMRGFVNTVSGLGGLCVWKAQRELGLGILCSVVRWVAVWYGECAGTNYGSEVFLLT